MRLFVLFSIVLIVFGFAATASAVNPQLPGEPGFVAGGTEGVVSFGPYTTRGEVPTSFSMWSTDENPFRVRLFYPGAASVGDFEANAWKVPSSFMDACPGPVDTMSGYYTFVKINAEAVAATDSVVVKPYFGGVNK